MVDLGTTVFNSDRGFVKKIESVQNNFTRKLFFRLGGYKYCTIPSSSFRNRKLKLISLESRRNTTDLVMIHKIVTGQCGLNAIDFFTFNRSRTRGTKEKISFPIPKTSHRAQFFTIRAGSKYLKHSKNKTIPSSLAAAKKYFSEKHL